MTQWLFQSLRDNLPYDQFVRKIIAVDPHYRAKPTKTLSRGWEIPDQMQENFMLRREPTGPTVQPMDAALDIAQVFLGTQLKCARCHNSFTNQWKLEDAWGLAGIIGGGWDLEVVRCEVKTGKKASPRFLFPELGNVSVKVGDRRAALAQLADLVTKPENGRFARTIVNRLWARLFGRGLVEPIDEMEQPPWHADLLDWLASDLVEHRYDLKRTLAVLLTSGAYRMPAVADSPLSKGYVFKGPHVRRLTAEQFVDGVRSLTGSPGSRRERGSASLQHILGRPSRTIVTTSRDHAASTMQALELANGPDLHLLLYKPETVAALVKQVQASRRDFVARIFQHALARDPTEAERKLTEDMLAGVPSPRGNEGISGVLWGLVMLPEFQLIH
jgi:hypothetical protein